MPSRRALFRAAFGGLTLDAARRAIGTGALTLGLAGAGLLPRRARAQAAARPITTSALGDLHLIQGAGCNIVALAGDDGTLIVDGGLAANAGALLDAVLTVTGKERVARLVNTHWHPEQTGVNVAVGRAGGAILAHETTALYLGQPVRSAVFDGVLEPLPEIGRPTETVRSDGTLEFAGRAIEYGYLPAAHTDGDLYVHFKDANVVAAGGVIAGDHWPLLDYRNGAWYGGRVRALQWLAELVEADTRVVPADGPTITGRDVVRQRDICLELFETLIEYMNRGFGPEDAAAANPLSRYAEEFGDASEFLYGAYRSMLIAYVPD